MTSTRLDLSGGEIPGQIQENLIAYMRLFAGLPGVVTHDTEDLYWMISGGGAPGNSILRARWSDEDAEQRIDALFAEIGQHIDQIDWMVYPGDQPSNLGKRLEARGMPGHCPGRGELCGVRHAERSDCHGLGGRDQPARSDCRHDRAIRARELPLIKLRPEEFRSFSDHIYSLCAITLVQRKR